MIAMIVVIIAALIYANYTEKKQKKRHTDEDLKRFRDAIRKGDLIRSPTGEILMVSEISSNMVLSFQDEAPVILSKDKIFPV